jgi:hypothetical protein
LKKTKVSGRMECPHTRATHRQPGCCCCCSSHVEQHTALAVCNLRCTTAYKHHTGSLLEHNNTGCTTVQATFLTIDR